MLTVSRLEFEYTDQRIFTGLTFFAEAGSLVHVQGANGRGKSTLLKLLAGLLHPTQGTIAFQGTRCYIGHKPGVNAQLTPREHWQFDLAQENPLPALHKLGLTGVEDTPCRLLSAGLQRRVSLLRLLGAPTALWLLDEPLVSLDQAGILCLSQLMQEHLAAGGLVVVTSHQPLPLDWPLTQGVVL